MSHAVCVQSFPNANLSNAIAVIEEAVALAGLRRQSDYISRVWVFCTPHFSDLIQEVAQAAVSKSNCMNVWGACVSGLLQAGQVTGHEPGVMVAVFGKEFEPGEETTADSPTMRFCIADSDSEAVVKWSQADLRNTHANTLGLLSYGANYVRMPRIDHGRVSHTTESSHALRVKNPLVLNSEGLTFLTDPMVVTQANGLFLIEVDGGSAASTLQCPSEQTRPVGLRLQIIHEQGESWVPVMEIHADGTLGLAAPVLNGQRVRLAKRTPKAIEHDIALWQPTLNQHFRGKKPEFGILFAGFERSQMCHASDDDIAAVVKAFPDTLWIGLFGQAAWLGLDNELITPPRNNRISICLFNTHHV